MFDNFYVRSLLGPEGLRLPPGGVTKEHKERAMSVLERFSLVIPSQYVRESLWPVLDTTFKWRLADDSRQASYQTRALHTRHSTVSGAPSPHLRASRHATGPPDERRRAYPCEHGSAPMVANGV
eukprot:4473818-Pyramimonas_sp.AAC.1